ncbi:hypothetical protein BJ165DRAFT_460284 [Panaeolus papilionaceus]|nr:hypothetical protein BJ165DRAFT_460284 [Panaeolus papilionaceus]
MKTIVQSLHPQPCDDDNQGPGVHQDKLREILKRSGKILSVDLGMKTDVRLEEVSTNLVHGRLEIPIIQALFVPLARNTACFRFTLATKRGGARFPIVF